MYRSNLVEEAQPASPTARKPEAVFAAAAAGAGAAGKAGGAVRMRQGGGAWKRLVGQSLLWLLPARREACAGLLVCWVTDAWFSCICLCLEESMQGTACNADTS